jgi:hypothetical protein
MDDQSENSTRKEKKEQHSKNQSFEQTISYNLSEEERPGGLKVRFKVKIATGKQAAALDARQAEAMRGLLLWARQYRTQQREELPGSR